MDTHEKSAPSTLPTGAPIGETLSHHLDVWVERGLINQTQARRILEAERTSSHRAVHSQRGRGAGQPSLTTEALGYVGGILVLIATALIGGQYFDDLGTLGRLGVVGVGAGALLTAGQLVPVRPGRPATGRLRSVLWVLTVAAVAGFIGLLASESFTWSGEDEAFVTASGAAVVALVLWRQHSSVLQQVTVVATLTVALGSGAATHLGGDIAVSGLAIWVFGALWLLLGWAGIVRPRPATDVLGGLVLTVGAALTMDHDVGAGLSLLTVAGLVLTGVRMHALRLLVVGSLATLIVVPSVVQRYFPETLAAPLALLVCGVLLVVAALTTVSRRGPSALSDPVARP